MSKRKRKIPEILDIDEQKKLLNVFNIRYPTALRNKAMVRLMLTAGLRLSEAINLRWDNINFRAGKLKVEEGKGRKDRQLWLGENTLNLLGEWRERQSKVLEEKGQENNENLVFTTLAGNKLNQVNVRKMVYRYAEKAGVQEEVTKHYRDKEGHNLQETYKEKKVTPHTLRHTFATDLYRDTKDIRQVQKALGHSDLSTTMIYTHLVDEDLQRDMEALDKKL
ncbi:MAG: tyrosine-type recombinase/integrase [bacterium]